MIVREGGGRCDRTRCPNSSDPWARYVPDEAMPWDLRRVVHLHRRAGFGATWDEIQRDLKDGPGPSIDRLLAGKARARGVPDGFAAFADRLADLALAAPEPNRLKGWWVYRMLFGPDPLTERLTLMWQDHFATSNLKVNDLALMRRQNETLHSLGRGPFGRLVEAMLRDPALLVWLDAQENTKGHPNENLARELMELFTLGIGYYSEDDVKQAARALTGWKLVDDQARFVPARHDAGTKTILGRTAAFDAGGLAGLLIEQPATARRLAWRLGHEFFGERAVDKAALDALAEGLRRTTWTSAGASPRCFARDGSSTVPTWAGASRARSNTPWARCGPSRCSTRRRALRCWPTGAGDWARISSIRPTSAGGLGAGPGSRPARRSAGRTSRRPWSPASRSAWARRSTRSPWPAPWPAA